MPHAWIRFKRTYTVQAVDGPTYRAGSVHELNPTAALHFVRRGIAEQISAEQAAVALANPQPVEEPAAAPPEPKPPARELTTHVDLHTLLSRERRRLGVEHSGEAAATPTQAEHPLPASNLKRVRWKVDVAPPLVSCIMPTWDRRPFIAQAIECFLAQTWPRKELIILDDGDDPIKDLVPKKRILRYVRLDARISTGAKRNKCCELAKGELIAHFDDDDWSAPDRLENQVTRLLASGHPITGYATLYFWDVVNNLARRYVASTPGYVCGTTLMFYRKFWKDHRFPDKHMGSDNDFINPHLREIAASHDHVHMVGRIHDCHHTRYKPDVGQIVTPDQLPPAFWDSEKARLGE